MLAKHRDELWGHGDLQLPALGQGDLAYLGNLVGWELWVVYHLRIVPRERPGVTPLSLALFRDDWRRRRGVLFGSFLPRLH